MKLLYTLILIVLLAEPLFSQDVQRMGTDFRGVATNGKTVVAYGDYGLITITRDYGKTWSQTAIGDKHRIKKIFSVGNDFIGVTDHTLIKSTDEGKTWIKALEPFNKPVIIDAALSGNTLYLLTGNDVWTANMNLKLSATPLINLDTASQYTEITTDGENIYVISDRIRLTHYSIASQSSRTDSISATLPPNQAFRFVSNFKISGGILYSILHDYGGMFEYLIRSKDKGKTWEYISPFLFNTGNIYTIENDSIYFLVAKPVVSSKIPRYYTIDSSHYATDSSYFTVINDKDSLERTFDFLSFEDNRFTGIATVNRDTMIAVGKNRMIFISYNGGKSWHMRSYFSADHSRGDEKSHFIDENRGYFVVGKSIFATTDGGITWLPQSVMSNTPKTSDVNISYFNNEGRGYIRYPSQNPGDTNIIMTNDYGDTYTMYTADPFLKKGFYPTSHQGIAIDDIILYASDNTFNGLVYSLIVRYDDQFRFIDSVRINARTIESVNAAPDGNLYILALNTSGENRADSLGNTDTYSYSYFMLKSNDKGKTWDSIAIDIPISQDLFYNNTNKRFLFLDRLLKKKGIVQGDYILYPAAMGLIYRFNYKNTTFDSVQAPGRLSREKNTVFRLKDKLYAVSEANNQIYYTDWDTFNIAIPVWDSIATTNLFTGWKNYDPTNNLNDKDAILSVQILNDSTAIMLIGFSRQILISTSFKVNVVKFSLSTTTTDIGEPVITGRRVYMWNSPPYPLPGKNIIASRIYWDNDYDMATGSVTVHDISGMLLPEQKIHIDKMQDYNGLLQWDCSTVPMGVYIIKITLAGESLSFPVMVAR